MLVLCDRSPQEVAPLRPPKNGLSLPSTAGSRFRAGLADALSRSDRSRTCWRLVGPVRPVTDGSAQSRHPTGTTRDPFEQAVWLTHQVESNA